MSHSIQSPSRPASRLLVSLATYNEAGNLQPLVQTIRQFAPESSILIIDDNSPDGTGKIADELAAAAARDPRDPPAGQARAGDGHAGGHPLRDRQPVRLPAEPRRRLQPPAPVHPGHARWHGRSRCHDRLAIRAGRRGRGWIQSQAEVHELWYQLVRPDLAGPYQQGQQRRLPLLPGQQARPDRPGQVRSRGYSFQEEILFWCKRVGCRFGETPILFENRRFGTSKINMGEAASALWILLRLGVGRVRG